ncbi:phage tail assembly chaperone G [Enterococcus alcedinis]|uniref:Uncharacterized protein n=1 Tax=Enterococcus alcedinis TaxID=1274384 RepID=A0A917N451_9ENTE|nr:hypothetical protein [Enterococcus alcedinis]MBP2100960.1 hypothetical protein [Enterococcus alcedinis]GGI64744.1 hypothetical protein GCM10011482_03980 [Enterococcus alcedinis]
MSEERTVKLQLRDDKGQMKEYFFDFVSQSKKLEYIRKEAALEERVDASGNKVETRLEDYQELQAEFVAGLFADKAVTKKAILEGLDSHDFKQIFEIIRYRVLGNSRKEDEEAKKAQEEQMKKLLAGLDSTTSNSDL